MDFCNKRYGLLHVPSLAVLLNRKASDEVHRLLSAGQPPVETFAAAAHLPEAEQVDLAHRMTTRAHERRHFHDVLLTPVGNQLFVSALGRSAVTLLLAKKLSRNRGRHLPLPLGTETIGMTQEILDLHNDFERQYLRNSGAARFVFEASATLMQLTIALRDLKGRAFDLLVADFARDPRYGTPLNCLRILLARVTAAERYRLATCFNIFIQLCLSNPNLPRPDRTHDDTFATMMGSMLDKKSGELLAAMERAVEGSWTSVEENLNLFGDYFAKDALHALERVIALYGKDHQDIANIYRTVMDEFSGAAREMRQKVIASPDDYVTGERYLEASWCEPFEYAFSPCDETLPRSWAPAGPQLSDAWRDFTYAFAPVGALMEPRDYLHPLQGPWLRQMERMFDIRFTRRFRSP